MDSDSDMELCLLVIVSLTYVCHVLVQNNFFTIIMSELYVFFVKKGLKVMFTKLSPFSTWPLFCYHDNNTFDSEKIDLRVYTINLQSFITIHSQTHNASLNAVSYTHLTLPTRRTV